MTFNHRKLVEIHTVAVPYTGIQYRERFCGLLATNCANCDHESRINGVILQPQKFLLQMFSCTRYYIFGSDQSA